MVLSVMVKVRRGMREARVVRGKHARRAANAMCRRLRRRGIECEVRLWQKPQWWERIVRNEVPVRPKGVRCESTLASYSEIAKMLDREFPEEGRHSPSQARIICEEAMGKLRVRCGELHCYLDSGVREISVSAV